MTKLNKLKKQATTFAKARGHILTRFIKHPFNEEVATAKCMNCNRAVSVCSNPSPNEIDIGGEAVALYCR